MDTGDYFQFLLALIFVLGLIGGLTLLVRRFGFGSIVLPKGAGSRRLAVVAVAALDGRRRLVLVRRDAVEHLILLGISGETVIESKISTNETGAPEGALKTTKSDLPATTTPKSGRFAP